MGNLIIVSSDSHAAMPSKLWPDYFDRRYHEHLPQIQYESDLYSGSVVPLSKMVMGRAEIVEEHLSASGGYRGVYDLDIRLAQMDREGIAAEVIYHGDARVGDLAHNVTNSVWPFEIWDAGVRAYNRWVKDTFGAAPDRLLLVGAIGSCTDMDATVAELGWLADQGFTGTFAPGFLTHPDMPPLFDPYWEPLWLECAARHLAIFVHAGFGFEQGFLYEQLDRVNREVKEANGSEMDLVMRLATEVFKQEFFSDIKARRPMWQMMYSGVFDRHPDLRLVLTEVRLDWIPSMLGHLDALFDQHRADIPAKRPPQRVLCRALSCRRVVRAQGRGGDAPRDRRPHHRLRTRLPAPGGHVAQHPRLAARRVCRRSGRRAPSHARGERHRIFRSRPGTTHCRRRAHRPQRRRDLRQHDCRSRPARHLRWPRRLPPPGRRR